MSPKRIFPALVLTVATSVTMGCSPGESGDGFRNTGQASPLPGSVILHPERIPLLDGGFFSAERGTAYLPVNRSDAGSGVLALEVYRFPASEAATPGTPPIFFLHGGPSFVGLESQLEELGNFEERWLPFLDVSDVVVVSQRGIGPSKPTTTIDLPMPSSPLDQEIDEAAFAEQFRSSLVRDRDYWMAQGLDLQGFTILEAAADIDDIRRALGYEKITIWGGSFGSHWGMAVMRYYPDIVERAILWGMEGPDHTYDHPGHIWRVYGRVAEDAEASPEFQGMIPEGGLIQAITSVMDRISTDPFSITVADPRTGAPTEVLFSPGSPAGRGLARGYSGGLESWPADVITLARGDFTGAAQAAVLSRSEGGRGYMTASYFMLDCGSGITPERWEEYTSDPAVALIGTLNDYYVMGCPVWDSDLGDDFRQNFETEIPTVIVHGTWDTSTPYENAQELIPFFTNSRHVPVYRGPHGSIGAARDASEEFDRAILKFATTGDWSDLPESVEIPEPEWVVPGR